MECGVVVPLKKFHLIQVLIASKRVFHQMSMCRRAGQDQVFDGGLTVHEGEDERVEEGLVDLGVAARVIFNLQPQVGDFDVVLEGERVLRTGEAGAAWAGLDLQSLRAIAEKGGIVMAI